MLMDPNCITFKAFMRSFFLRIQVFGTLSIVVSKSLNADKNFQQLSIHILTLFAGEKKHVFIAWPFKLIIFYTIE